MPSKKLDFDNRDTNSVVHRFMSDEPVEAEAAANDLSFATDASTALSPTEDAQEIQPRTTRKIAVLNTMLQTVIDELESTIKHLDICKCDRCFSDMCAIVLNRVTPHYVTTSTGVLYDKATMLNIVTLSKISVEVFKAIEIVSKNPNHD